MNAAYIIAAIVGAGLVVASLFGAFDEHEIGDGVGTNNDLHDGHDHGDGHDQSGVLSNLPILSIRFWVFTVAAFGLIGVLLNALDAGSEAIRALAAVLGGIVTGTTVWAGFRLTRRLEAGEDASARQFVGQIGSVVVPVRGATPGKIRLHMQGQTVEVLAVADDRSHVFEIASPVFVLSVRNGYAHVVPTDEILGGPVTPPAPPVRALDPRPETSPPTEGDA